MTNRERLLQELQEMSDEELAKFLCEGFGCDNCPGYVEDVTCGRELVKWLKEEHDDD